MTASSGSVLARQTLDKLMARISSGEWPVGGRIPTEPELEEQLGVGRSTVREAVRSLATLGMVETLPAKGTFVRSLTPAPSLLLDALAVYQPAELIGIRRALDVEAAQSAAAAWTDARLAGIEEVLAHQHVEADKRRRTPVSIGSWCSQFHSAIAQASGNRLLADLDTSLSASLDGTGLSDRATPANDPQDLVAQHARILEAIKARDVATAAHLMALHLDGALRTLDHQPIVTEMTTLGDLKH